MNEILKSVVVVGVGEKVTTIVRDRSSWESD